MTTAFDTDAEITALESFLSEAAHGFFAETGDFAAVRQKAEMLLKRLVTPVRTMMAGEFSSGKSTLANLLVGEQLIPTSVLASPLPPVVFRHGATLSASACWWKGREPQPFARPDFDAIMAVEPDYVVLTAPNPILKRVSIFDTPGTADPDREGEALIELSARAEMIIWCTNAVQAWRESERHIWSQLAPSVTRNGILAVTHVDLPSVRIGYDRIMARLTREAKPLFRAIYPIDAPSAIEAAPGGVVVDEAQWTESGGAELFKGILDLATAIRLPDVMAARELITNRIGPILDAARRPVAPPPKPAAPAAVAEPAPAPEPEPEPMPGPVGEPVAEAATQAEPPNEAMPEPAPVPDPVPEPMGASVAATAAAAPAAKTAGAKVNPLSGLAKLREKALKDAGAAKPAPAPAAPPAPPARHAHPLVADWQGKVDALIAQVSGSADPEDSGFLQSASETVMEMLDAISEPGVLDDDTAWIQGQFQEAVDTIILMQMESGASTIEDAATLLLQLSRDIAVVAGR